MSHPNRNKTSRNNDQNLHCTSITRRSNDSAVGEIIQRPNVGFLSISGHTQWSFLLRKVSIYGVCVAFKSKPACRMIVFDEWINLETEWQGSFCLVRVTNVLTVNLCALSFAEKTASNDVKITHFVNLINEEWFRMLQGSGKFYRFPLCMHFFYTFSYRILKRVLGGTSMVFRNIR